MFPGPVASGEHAGTPIVPHGAAANRVRTVRSHDTKCEEFLAMTSRPRLKRTMVLLGMVGAVGAAMFVPATANAATPIGADPGHLAFNPASGPITTTPTWSTDTACGTSFSSSAKLEVVEDSGTKIAVSGTVAVVTAPFSGTLQASLATIKSAAHMVNGNTYEFVVMCQDATLDQDPEQSEFLTLSADGSSFSTASTPPAPAATATTTTLSANPTTTTSGDAVALTATVAASDTAGNDAVGNVEFFDGSTSLGTAPVSGGTASMTVSTLPVGSDSLTAKFEPTDSTKFASSTSAAVMVTVNAGTSANNTETINVNIPQPETGTLTLSVNNTPVTLSAPKNIGTALESTGALSPITVTDSRTPNFPGWNLSGQVSDFTSGSNTFSGNDLGWVPLVTVQDAAGDVVAGPTVNAGATPGLTSASALASAAAGAGSGSTTLGANLDLQVPVNTAAGNYSATLTVTLLSK